MYKCCSGFLFNFRLCVSSVIENIQKSSSRLLHVTQVVSAEPMKKRKRIDPKVVQARLDRRKRKIEKQIRRLQKNARQLKPIDEIEIPKAIWNREDRKYAFYKSFSFIFLNQYF